MGFKLFLCSQSQFMYFTKLIQSGEFDSILQDLLISELLEDCQCTLTCEVVAEEKRYQEHLDRERQKEEGEDWLYIIDKKAPGDGGNVKLIPDVSCQNATWLKDQREVKNSGQCILQIPNSNPKDTATYCCYTTDGGKRKAIECFVQFAGSRGPVIHLTNQSRDASEQEPMSQDGDVTLEYCLFLENVLDLVGDVIVTTLTGFRCSPGQRYNGFFVYDASDKKDAEKIINKMQKVGFDVQSYNTLHYESKINAFLLGCEVSGHIFFCTTEKLLKSQTFLVQKKYIEKKKLANIVEVQMQKNLGHKRLSKTIKYKSIDVDSICFYYEMLEILGAMTPSEQQINESRTKVLRHELEAMSNLAGEFHQQVTAQGIAVDVHSFPLLMQRYHNTLQQLEDQKKKRIFLGNTSQGKSTFINAFLGKKILPANIGCTTTHIFSISGNRDDQYRFSVHEFEENSREPTVMRDDKIEKLDQFVECIKSFNEPKTEINKIGDKVEEVQKEEAANEENEEWDQLVKGPYSEEKEKSDRVEQKQTKKADKADVKLVHLSFPISKYPMLGYDIVILDSPGMGHQKAFDAAVKSRSGSARTIILLSDVETDFNQSDKDYMKLFYSQAARALPYVVMNKWDKVYRNNKIESEREKIKEYLKKGCTEFLTSDLNYTEEEAKKSVFFLSGEMAFENKSYDGTPVEFDFKTWVKQVGLTEEVSNKLESENATDPISLKEIATEEDEVLKSVFEFKWGDIKKLKHHVAKIDVSGSTLSDAKEDFDDFFLIVTKREMDFLQKAMVPTVLKMVDQDFTELIEKRLQTASDLYTKEYEAASKNLKLEGSLLQILDSGKDKILIKVRDHVQDCMTSWEESIQKKVDKEFPDQKQKMENIEKIKAMAVAFIQESAKQCKETLKDQIKDNILTSKTEIKKNIERYLKEKALQKFETKSSQLVTAGYTEQFNKKMDNFLPTFDKSETDFQNLQQKRKEMHDAVQFHEKLSNIAKKRKGEREQYIEELKINKREKETFLEVERKQSLEKAEAEMEREKMRAGNEYQTFETQQKKVKESKRYQIAQQTLKEKNEIKRAEDERDEKIRNIKNKAKEEEIAFIQEKEDETNKKKVDAKKSRDQELTNAENLKSLKKLHKLPEMGWAEAIIKTIFIVPRIIRMRKQRKLDEENRRKAQYNENLIEQAKEEIERAYENLIEDLEENFQEEMKEKVKETAKIIQNRTSKVTTDCNEKIRLLKFEKEKNETQLHNDIKECDQEIMMAKKKYEEKKKNIEANFRKKEKEINDKYGSAVLDIGKETTEKIKAVKNRSVTSPEPVDISSFENAIVSGLMKDITVKLDEIHKEFRKKGPEFQEQIYSELKGVAVKLINDAQEILKEVEKEKTAIFSTILKKMSGSRARIGDLARDQL